MTTPSEQSFDPRSILASLERSRTTYVVIGGLARVLRGADDTTTGVDICPTFGVDNVERLNRAVSELNAVRRDGQELVLTEDVMSGEPVIALSTGFGELNIVSKPAGVARGCVALRGAASKENLGHGLQPYVAAAGDLASMAGALHRDRDIERLPELRRIMELEVDRHQTIGPPSSVRGPAVRGPEVRGPTIHGPSGSPVRQDWPRRSGPWLTP